MSRILASLPVLGSLGRCAKPKGAEPSRLQAKAERAKADGKAEKGWRRDVWIRDHGCCRWCKRKVAKTLSLVPERGEVHHVSGRVVKEIRWDRRNGLLVCAACHERLTGKVAEKFVLIPTRTFTVEGVAYANADYAVRFKRVA
jgi:hypothetical protein